MSSRPIPQDSYVRLWTGENPAVHDALLEQLQSAGIPFVDRPFGGDQVAPTADPLPIDWRARFGFEVSVPSRHLSQARQVLETLLDQENLADVEIPAADQAAPKEQPSPGPAGERPTAGVWTGSDRQVSQFLVAALHGTEIPIR